MQIEDVKMNPFTLRFPDELERPFSDDYFEKSLRQIRIALILGIILWCSIGFLDGWIAPYVKSTLWFIRYGVYLPCLALLLLTTFLQRFRRYMQVLVSLGLLMGLLCVIDMIALAPAPGKYLYYSGIIIFLMYPSFIKMRFIYTFFTSWLLIGAYVYTAVRLVDTPELLIVSTTGLLLSANIISLFTNYLLELYARRNYLQQRLLEVEREKSERLLRNILPGSVAARLKKEHRAIADGFAEVTVLFADIVGFTQLAAVRTPEEVVNILNEVFSEFDRLAEKHGVEKIKTIGDAYMAVAGLPEKNDHHCQAVAELALEMQEVVARHRTDGNGPLKLRVGINTGPVVAGVIGMKKFIYDVWGDTVNTASRMESHGQAGSIQVTRQTYERLKHAYIFEERGTLSVKGKGEMETYFLTGRQLSAARSEK